MARTIHLHIGPMKSGTTYLQNLLDCNEAMLAESGLLWPGARAGMEAGFDLFESEMSSVPPGAWSRLAHRIRGHDRDALISIEFLVTADKGQIRQVSESLAPARLHLIITARDLSRVIPSHWQETTRNRKTVSWAEFAKQVCQDEPAEGSLGAWFWEHHDIARIVENWSSAVPIEQMTLVTVPKSRDADPPLWARFLAAMGLAPDHVSEPARWNASLGPVSAELMRRVNQEVAELSWADYRFGFKAALAKQTLASRVDAEPRLALSAGQQQWVVARAGRMIEALQRLGVPVVGDLEDLRPALEPAGAPYDPETASDAELLDAAIAGLAGLGEKLAEMRRQRDALRRELRSRDRGGQRPPRP